MADDAIPIRPGVPVGHTRDTSEVVNIIRGLLARAEKGEIDAIAWATTSPNNEGRTGWEGGHGTRDKLATGIMVLQHRYAQAIVEKADDA